MLVPGYEITQEIASHEWLRVLRGRRTADGRPVLLKIARTQAGAEMLDRESALLRELTIAGVPRVVERFDVEGEPSLVLPALVLEDVGGAPLRSLPGLCLPGLDAFFALAIQLATTLGELHQRDIVLHCLSPDTLFYNAETGEAGPIEFGFATRAAGDARTPRALLQSALAYVSPEQTGRMNRAVDYRSDFYSLGVTLYELLTGQPPFLAADPLDLIHQHIARSPAAPTDRNPGIPEPLSRIVMKLLAKTAEERYQSARGLVADLERCARDWAAHQRIEPFAPGAHDATDRFNIPQRLYGREREVAHLATVFGEVCQGKPVLMLVAGYSGIGKTSLIQELYKPIIRERGYFIAGKFDQVARGTPFGALVQAMRGLVRQLLAESEERLAAWRVRLSEALGSQGGVLTDVIPEIERIVGPQPPPASLGPTESLNRFQLVFQNFIGAIARREHPLVIFLDDLQWADAASLSLLEPLLTGSNVESLLLIGAYRDNEVDDAHPLMRCLGVLESAGVAPRRIALAPLEAFDLVRFVHDSLHGSLAEAEPLALLALEKTGGNPFFVIQFLKSLERDGLLRFDREAARWTYRIEEIARAGVTDNVVDLMTRKIQRLSDKTQRTLTLAACIGNRFDARTLALVSEQSAAATEEALGEAIREGLVLLDAEDNPATHTSQWYAFLHDRVQQAAYALIPEEWKQLAHLSVGRLLRDSADREEKLFDIVNHLNQGDGLIADEAERLALARLNLEAGRKAKSSTAYETALAYLEAGARLAPPSGENGFVVPPSGGSSGDDLPFELRIEAAECLYLCGDFDEVERRVESLLDGAHSALDKARVLNLCIRQYENMSRYADALAAARRGLAPFGVEWPESEAEKARALDREIETIQSLIGDRAIESLVDLPVMSNPETRMVMKVLTNIWPSAYITGNAVLARLFSAMMVRLSLERGNLEESAYGYVTHAITVGPMRGQYAAAYEFGRLALAVNERFGDGRLRAKIHQQFHAHVALWRQPMAVCIHHAREACRAGLENGDFLYATYGAFTETWPAIVSARDLGQFLRDYAPGLTLIRKLKNASFGDACELVLNWVRALRGETRAPRSLSYEGFDEAGYVETYRGNPFFTIFHAAARMQIDYLFGEYEAALAASRMARGIVPNLAGMIWTPFHDFWNSLVLAANFAAADEATRRDWLDEMRQSRAALAVLAENCPANYRCWHLLVSAEIERVTGAGAAAVELYEQAIADADANDSVQHRALVHELCGRFWRGRGQHRVAEAFLTEARRGYARWGASAIAERLQTAASAATPLDGVTAGLADTLDLSSAMKAAQAIAGEMNLASLLAKLMQIAIENAGAEHGRLILKHGDRLEVHGETGEGPLESSPNLAVSVVNYALHSSESLVLADAAADDRFASDAYLQRRRPRSVMCVPMLRHGEPVGALYLENNLAAGAFTEDRLAVMQVLASQAAISIENARLYDEMTVAENTLRSIMEGTAAVTGDDFFASLVRNLAEAMGVRYAFVTECRERPPVQARTLAFWMGNRLAGEVSYEIAETPCLKVLGGETCYYPNGVRHLFPNDQDLVTMGAEGYLGIPMRNAAGATIGHLAILDDKPLPSTPRSLSMLNIFAARAGAELERLHVEQELRRALAEVERLKNQFQAETRYLQEEIRHEHNFEEIIGSSPALLDVLTQVERVAPTDATVLILGETGTGKELIARAIHDNSPRRARALVKVNCGAISAGLVESELFGHVKGAFTGANDKRTGRFELADGGTLFLDEVGELPLETQVKLLRVLQEGEFEPVGSSRTVKVDVRVIAATNRNLEDEVRAGRFRADLFYRLNVLPLHNPPLRQRKEDIPQLALFFLARFARRFGKAMDGITQETMDLLQRYDWPGNIRELQNLIERGVVLGQGSTLTLDRSLLHVQAETRPAVQAAAQTASVPIAPAESSPVANPPASLDELQRQHILHALTQANWVIEGDRGAAKLLDLHPNTLRSRLKKMGIQRPK